MKLQIGILFLLIITQLQGQSSAVMQIDYEVQIASDSLAPEKKMIHHYSLLLNQNSSLFYNKEAKDYYNALKDNKLSYEKNGVLMPVKYPKANASVYKFDDKIIATFPIGRDLISFPEPALKWTLLSDIKSIQNMKCQLAKTTSETNQVFYAWFTNDIPFSEGPFRFKGLSGTILELYNADKSIQITAYNIKQSNDIIEKIPYTKVVHVDNKNKFLEFRNNFYNNPGAYNNLPVFDASGNSITDRYNERLKKVNTFID